MFDFLDVIAIDWLEKNKENEQECFDELYLPIEYDEPEEDIEQEIVISL